MEREDPLERLERKEKERNAAGGLRNVMFVLIAAAVILAGALVYVLITKNQLVNQLNVEKSDLTEQIEALQSDYENLSSEYDVINSQLDSSREEIAQLVERVKKTDATNRAKIRQYEKELGTLRSIMRNYIVQIDSLNTLNHKLTQEAASARKEAAASKRLNKELTAQVETLTGRVTAGSVVRARGLSLTAYNSADKPVDNSKRTVRLLANLSLLENTLAEAGPLRVYIRVYDPEGNLLQDGRGTTFTFEGETLEATASREVDYQGNEVDLGIYVNNIPAFKKGVYTVEAFTESAKLGSAELLLR